MRYRVFSRNIVVLLGVQTQTSLFKLVFYTTWYHRQHIIGTLTDPHTIPYHLMWCHMLTRDNLLWSPVRFHVMPHHLEHDATWSDITCSLVWSNLCTYLICVMTSHDLTWPHMTSHDLIWFSIIAHDLIWCDVTSSHLVPLISCHLTWSRVSSLIWSHVITHSLVWSHVSV